jgi:hypothetical protein
MNKKLIKIEFIYEDGESQSLEGDKAQEWFKSVSDCVLISTMHNCPMKQFDWITKNVSVDKGESK